jgi:hypothetical protein
VPAYLAALLVVRGAPALILLRPLGRRPAVAAGLPPGDLPPVRRHATQIGVATGLLSPVTAAGLVCAGPPVGAAVPGRRGLPAAPAIAPDEVGEQQAAEAAPGPLSP